MPEPDQGILGVHRQVQKIVSERVVSLSFRRQRRLDMATNKEKDKERPKGHIAMKTPRSYRSRSGRLRGSSSW
jgi:hypothetical protein